ncbi:MAG TPA: N-acetyl-gamma-glutamyl-phosphate reductase [Dehalococcoidia bacterium]|nr:N-acetyl-gamma-glutamyl-phosphate reductase [Dehalococcoidia bacterium]
MKPTKVSIINITSYAGAELARLLLRHPKVQITSVTGRSEVGKRVGEVLPHLSEIDLTIKAEPKDADLVFSSLPHKASAEALLPLIERGIKIVDLSADFRLKEAQEYQRWYDFTHPAPELLKEAVYGLTEFHREQVIHSSLVANPGCYPTSALLALAPAVKEGLIYPDIIIDSKSGLSGAGRTLSLETHYPEANESVSAYSLEGHRHLPEILQELEALRPDFSLLLTFLPHLVPMTRGMLSSCYARLVEGKLADGEKGIAELRKIYRDFYKGEPFVRIVDVPPQTKHTWGSNLCLIYPTIDLRTNRLIVVSCLDNLVKGAAGQAIQNMNLMLGFPETMGLEALAIYP